MKADQFAPKPSHYIPSIVTHLCSFLLRKLHINMSDAGPSTSKGSVKSARGKVPGVEEAREPMPPFKPAKYGLNERQVVDFVKTATAKNIWYYRYVG